MKKLTASLTISVVILGACSLKEPKIEVNQCPLWVKPMKLSQETKGMIDGQTHINTVLEKKVIALPEHQFYEQFIHQMQKHNKALEEACNE